jgi:hypothetical protein
LFWSYVQWPDGIRPAAAMAFGEAKGTAQHAGMDGWIDRETLVAHSYRAFDSTHTRMHVIM